jgi:ketosteroid isomerase-like protein
MQVQHLIQPTKEAMSTPIEIAQKYIHAVQSGDQAALGALLAPDIVWHQPGNNRFSGTHQGVQAVGGMIGAMMEVSKGTFAITRANRFMGNGPWVTVEIEFEGQRDGLRMSQQGIDLLRIEEGRIVEARLFSSDPAQEDAFWGR